MPYNNPANPIRFSCGFLAGFLRGNRIPATELLAGWWVPPPKGGAPRPQETRKGPGLARTIPESRKVREDENGIQEEHHHRQRPAHRDPRRPNRLDRLVTHQHAAAYLEPCRDLDTHGMTHPVLCVWMSWPEYLREARLHGYSAPTFARMGAPVPAVIRGNQRVQYALERGYDLISSLVFETHGEVEEANRATLEAL